MVSAVLAFQLQVLKPTGSKGCFTCVARTRKRFEKTVSSNSTTLFRSDARPPARTERHEAALQARRQADRHVHIQTLQASGQHNLEYKWDASRYKS